MKLRFLLLAFVACCANLRATPFELRDGDRVVFLGDTLMEREQYYGYIELALTSHFADRKISFRNLGWSADTPKGSSRFGLSKLQAGHEPADECWTLLLEQIELTKPTVVFLGYGMANSFDGEKGLAQFITDLEKLIDAIREKASKDVRFVLLSPIRHENLGSPLPDPKVHNEQLALYWQAIASVANKRGFPFVHLFQDLKIETTKKATHPLTDNGIHLNAAGYQQAALAIENALGWKPGKWQSKRNEAVRREILKKNELFFNRSRPQNMAYLLGFRKHEQGKNAAEIPMYDPLLTAEDEKIHQLVTAQQPIPKTKPPVKTVASTNKSDTLPLPTFDLAPGVEVNLFAEDPLLAKPIQMNFDAQGKLWIASSAIYPMVEPGQAPIDKIIVVEDTNGDGKADKSTVFVDGLLVPTAVIPGDGGVYVGQSTELLFFKDTNGDAKADERKIVLSGFGTEDSHHNVHTLRWGPDGQLYFNQSIYIRTDTETPNGVVRLKSGGIFNLRGDSMDLDVFVRGFCNTWGHAFDAYGQSFITDGCGGQGISFGIRSATYFTYANMRREMKSITPGSYPKFCGLEILRSEHFPADWQDTLVTSDFRAHRVVRFKVTEDSAGFAGQELPEIMRSTDASFRPIDAKIGPDGALYIADWSNPIINHGEVDFRDPRRDHEHGRIWRVTMKDRALLKKPNLVRASNAALLDQLLSPNDFNRNQARRVLTERGDKVTRDLGKWTAKQTSDKARLESLWTYQSLGIVEPALLQSVLNANDGRVRAAAVRVLSFWLDQVPNASDLLAKAALDEHPRVRLEAVRALAKIPSARSAELVLSALNKPMDSFLDYGIWLSINELVVPWIQSVQNGTWKPDGREKQLEFGIKAVEPQFASVILEKSLGHREIPHDGSGPWIELIGYCGEKRELNTLFTQLLDGGFSDAATIRALTALDEAASHDRRPDGDLDGVQKLFLSTSDKVQVAAIKLAGNWKREGTASQILKVAANGKPEVQAAAFESLRQIGGATVIAGIEELLKNNPNINSRRRAAVTLAALDFKKAPPHLLNVALVTTNEPEATELWRSILAIKNAGPRLAKHLPKGLPAPVAKAALKVAREGGRNESEFILAITRSADLDDADKELTADELKQLAEAVSSQGEPHRGEKIYRRADTGCVICHAIGGAGGKVGPDLTSIGASAPLDYLIESVLFPNKKIKEGYHAIQVTTKDEQEYSGVLVRETEQELIIRDASNKELTVTKSKIDSRKNGASLMPAGLIDNLSSEDRADLFRFLSELGRPGPFDGSKGNVARAWKFFVMTARKEQIGIEKVVSGETTTDWAQLYTTVDGRLLKETIRAQVSPVAHQSVISGFAATKLQLASRATARLKLTTYCACELWLDGKIIGKTRETGSDGKAVETTSEFPIDLTQGKHAIVVKLDLQGAAPTDKIPSSIKLETTEGTFLLE